MVPNIYDALLLISLIHSRTIPQKNPKSLTDVLGKTFVFAFTWSFGNVFKRFEDDDQTEDHSCLATEFDALVRDLFDNSELGKILLL